MYVDNMPPIYGEPNYDFPHDDAIDNDYDQTTSRYEEDGRPTDLTYMAFWYMMVLIILLISWLLIFFCLRLIAFRQKTRNTQQRRMYTGSRTRQLSMQGEPTIFVSPANLPPPPKYEAMAPPSYEEVMAVQYPGFQTGPQPQPITQPITHAMAQGSSTDIPAVHTVTNTTNISNDNVNTRRTEVVASAPAIVTVTNEERRTSVIVASRA